MTVASVPVIERYPGGVLAAADLVTSSATFHVVRSMRLDSAPARWFTRASGDEHTAVVCGDATFVTDLVAAIVNGAPHGDLLCDGGLCAPGCRSADDANDR